MIFAIASALLSAAVSGCNVQANLGDGWFSMKPGQIPDMSIFTKTPMDYIEGTRTYDTFREAKTNNFPLTYTWTDATNVHWSVGITANSDSCTVAVPCNPETMFFGDETDRVGMDAQVNVCKFVFTYQPSSMWHSHGINCQSNGYRYQGMGIYMSDSDKWKSVLEMVKQGVDIASAATDVYTKAAAAAASGGVAAADRYSPVADYSVALQPQQRPQQRPAYVRTGGRGDYDHHGRGGEDMPLGRLRDEIKVALLREIADAQAYLNHVERMLK